MNFKSWNIGIFIVIAFFFRLILSFTIYNNDIHNHIAWMQSVDNHGWSGLYDRDVSPWASVNYPPLTLYTFYGSEAIYRLMPENLHTLPIHAALYKLPSILADCLIAYLIWRFLPFSQKWKYLAMFAYLFNPALMLNSVFWGQVESLSALGAIATVISLIKKRRDLALIFFTVGVLTKQNILPLTPLILLGIFLSGTGTKRIISALLFSLGLAILLYLPLVPGGTLFFYYVISSYLKSIGGQSHQYLASVNALNFWYFIGMNKTPDVHVRIWGLLLSLAGAVIGIYWTIRLRKDNYLKYWVSAIIISLWTFVFATRMHERHSYMLVAYLTFLLPFRRWRWIYFIVSGISFYNLLGVWQEYFVLPPSSFWSISMIVLAGIMFVIALITPFLPAEFLHQDRIKS